MPTSGSRGSSPACSTSTSAARSRHLGLHYAPDPSSQQACTIGGNVATNAGGPHCLAYGVTAAHVLAVDVVLADGSTAVLGGARARPARLRPARLLRRQRGHDGHRDPHRGAAHARPADHRDAAPRLHLDRGCRRATVSGIIAAGMLPAALEMMDARDHPRGRGLRRRGLSARCGGGAARRGRRPRRGRRRGTSTSSAVSARRTAPERARRGRRRRTCAALEGTQVGVRGDRPHRARLLPARRGGARAPSSSTCCASVYAIADEQHLTMMNVFHAGDGNLHPLIVFDARRARDLGARPRRRATRSSERASTPGGVLSGEHGVGLEKRDVMPLIFSRRRSRRAGAPARRVRSRRPREPREGPAARAAGAASCTRVPEGAWI